MDLRVEDVGMFGFFCAKSLAPMLIVCEQTNVLQDVAGKYLTRKFNSYSVSGKV